MNKSQGLRLKASHSMDATVGKDLLYTIVSSGKHTCFSHGMCMDCGCAWTLHCSSVWRGRRAPTWFRLEAQRCASLAWALSVSCLPVLSSTVTLPSPICLMNRRNYTHTTHRRQQQQQQQHTADYTTATGPLNSVSQRHMYMKISMNSKTVTSLMFNKTNTQATHPLLKC